MSGVLTGSLAFAGFVLAAETYRNYKEKEEANQEEQRSLEAKVGTYLTVTTIISILKCQESSEIKNLTYSTVRTINIFVFQEEQKIPEPAVSEGEAEVEKVYLIQVLSYVYIIVLS